MEDNTNTTASINQLLYDAALRGDVTVLQSLLQRDSFLVYRSSTNTSLHVACKLGHLQFTWELLRLNPSLSNELDPNDKSSPLHVASRNGHLELVKSLVSINPGTCFARDMYGMNPVHVAAVKGHLHVLDELLRAAPPAARERVGVVGGGIGESILHLCAKYNRVDAMKLVVGAVGDAEMLNAIDGDGNTVMHVAVANKQLEDPQVTVTHHHHRALYLPVYGDDDLLAARSPPSSSSNFSTASMESSFYRETVEELISHVNVRPLPHQIVRFLLGDGRVMKNAPNSKGLTSMDILKQSHKDVNNDHQLKLALKRFHVLQSEEIKREKEKGKNRHLEWLENQRSALMVVASLIATMAFQTGLNPPGGVWQDTTTAMNTTAINITIIANQTAHRAGLPIMAQQSEGHYKVFLVLNTVGLVASMSSILLLISGLPCRRFFLVLIMVTMWVAITAMAIAYGVVLYALTPEEDLKLVRKVILYSYCSWFFVMLLLFLGHLTWWTVRLLKFLGRLVKKLFKCCLPKRQIAY